MKSKSQVLWFYVWQDSETSVDLHLQQKKIVANKKQVHI